MKVKRFSEYRIFEGFLNIDKFDVWKDKFPKTNIEGIQTSEILRNVEDICQELIDEGIQIQLFDYNSVKNYFTISFSKCPGKNERYFQISILSDTAYRLFDYMNSVGYNSYFEMVPKRGERWIEVEYDEIDSELLISSFKIKFDYRIKRYS